MPDEVPVGASTLVLRGPTVTLRPLAPSDADALAAAASESRAQYALFEGIRRGDMPGQDGSVRNSAYYSIMRAEWPSVRKKLEDTLAR